MLQKLLTAVSNNITRLHRFASVVLRDTPVPLIPPPCSANLNAIQTRARGSMSFFNHLSAEQLWKSATSVSNAGRKRGRARGRRIIKNLNRGQILGMGKINMVWPGLNAPIIQGREIVQQKQLPPNPAYQENIFKLRDSFEKFRSLKIDPLERGWTGTKMPGRSIGPPDPVGDESFEQFDCKVLEMKQVANMTGTLGRVRRFSILVVTGNKKGLMSVALAKATDAKTALRKARNMSIRRLRFIELLEGRTVYHDIYHQIDSTGLFIKRMPEGAGVISHRLIKTICEVAGIRDLHVKIEGQINHQKIVKCFLAALSKQETYQQLAERKRMHVVEFKPENNHFPIVLASPKTAPVRKDPSENGLDEKLLFNDQYNEGKIKEVYEKKPPLYTRYPEYQRALVNIEKKRGWPEQKVRCWLESELKPSTFFDRFVGPDPGHPRTPIDTPKDTKSRVDRIPVQLKRIGV